MIVTTKKPSQKTPAARKRPTPTAAAPAAPMPRSSERASATGRAKVAQPLSKSRPRKRRGRTKPRTKVLRRRSATPPVAADTVHAALVALHRDVRVLTETVQQLAPPAPAAEVGGMASALDGSVDSLRRLLSELVEQRMESVVRALVDIRREAIADGLVAPIVDRLDDLLDSVGALRFDAEAMDVVDPLIHDVVEERWREDVPEGVILEALRHGYRTARGLVLCRAGVSVNRRS